METKHAAYLEPWMMRHLLAYCRRRFRNAEIAQEIIAGWLEKFAAKDRSEADFLVNEGWPAIERQASLTHPELILG